METWFLKPAVQLVVKFCPWLTYGCGGQKPKFRSSSEHPIQTTKMGSKMGGEFTYPEMVSLVLTHSQRFGEHMCLFCICLWLEWQSNHSHLQGLHQLLKVDEPQLVIFVWIVSCLDRQLFKRLTTLVKSLPPVAEGVSKFHIWCLVAMS